jgi:2-methylcitrate dehydratase
MLMHTIRARRTAEQQRFLSAVGSVAGLKAGDLGALNVLVDPRVLDKAPVTPPGIFR